MEILPLTVLFFVERNITAFSSQLISVVSACTRSVFEGRPHGSRFEVCVCALHSLASPAPLPPVQTASLGPRESNFPGAVGMLSRRPGPLISFAPSYLGLERLTKTNSSEVNDQRGIGDWCSSLRLTHRERRRSHPSSSNSREQLLQVK